MSEHTDKYWSTENSQLLKIIFWETATWLQILQSESIWGQILIMAWLDD